MSGEILFLAHRTPYPPDRGDKIRSWHLLRSLAKIAPVHVAALCDDPRDLDHVAFLRSVAATVHIEQRQWSKTGAMMRAMMTGQPASVLAFANRALQAHIDLLLATRPIRTIFAFSGQMAQFVPTWLDERRFVMDFVDMDSAKFAAYGDQYSGLAARANRSEAERLLAFETAVANRATLSLFVSEAEAHLFQSKTGVDQSRVASLENGIDLEAYDPLRTYPAIEQSEGPLIIFTGQMDYRPNIDAVTAFARDVMPTIVAHDKSARFAIVGRAPTPAVKALAKLPGVIVTGEVPDTRSWLAAADVVVAPLTLARGIQNKVLEAMAMAKPVVASSAAALGIDAEDGQELIVADGAQAQAGAIIALLASAERCRTIGLAARRRVEARYSWEARFAALPAIVGMGAT
ncbi:MAG: TIGR03087 family PEP-CTERM/XrtA system glycosyltransferase [Sphingomonadaceae bacterium]